MSSSLAAATLGIVFGYLMVPLRLALAQLYVGLGKSSAQLADTVKVRGKVGSDPYFPAIVCTAIIGLLAILMGITCAMLLPEEARSNPDSWQESPWFTGLIITAVLTLLCVGAVFLFHRVNKRWEARVLPEVPRGAFGYYGTPAKIVTADAAKRLSKARRRAFSPLDWSNFACGLAIAAGCIGLAAAVFLRQPGKYSAEVFYTDSIETTLHTVTLVSGLLFAAGLLGILATGVVSVARTSVVARRVVSGDKRLTATDRRIARTGSKKLLDSSTFLLAVWFALPIAAFGWYCARVTVPAMNERVSELPDYLGLGLLEWLGWLAVWLLGLVGLALLRAGIARRLPDIRNRLGYEAVINGPE
ncbi:hypothetical protein [Arthrobacter psychrolactophilus]